MDDFDDRADARALVGVQIESERAVNNLSSILSVSRVGYVFIGYGDLAVPMGESMNPEHPDVEATVEKIKCTCLEEGAPVGYTVSTTDAAEKAIEAGFRLVRIGDEVSTVRQTLGDRLKSLR